MFQQCWHAGVLLRTKYTHGWHRRRLRSDSKAEREPALSMHSAGRRTIARSEPEASERSIEPAGEVDGPVPGQLRHGDVSIRLRHAEFQRHTHGGGPGKLQ